MTSGRHVVGASRTRLRTELAVLFRNPGSLVSQVQVVNIALLILLSYLIGNDPIGGAEQPQIPLFVAGFVALAVCQATLLQLPIVLATDREDGTLLRVRGIPHGVGAYLLAKMAFVLVSVVVNLALVLAVSALVVDAPLPSGSSDWLTLLWVVFLGAAAAMLLGVTVGALLPNARQGTGWVLLPLVVLMGISGTVIPFSLMPGWVQMIASLFPLKWMAQGVRSALFDSAYEAAEVSGSWQHAETALVLSAWVVVGLLIAPRVIARSTRRETGSRLQERRDEAGRRVGL